MITICIISGSLQPFIMSWAIRNVRLPCKWTKILLNSQALMEKQDLLIYFFCQWTAVINGHQCACDVQCKPSRIKPWNSCNLLARMENGMTVHVKWHNDYWKRAACTDHNLLGKRISFMFEKIPNFANVVKSQYLNSITNIQLIHYVG